jgi:hypothetical protein
VTERPRLVVASLSVALVAGVACTAAALGPPDEVWLWFSAIFATLAAVQSVASAPRDLGWALALASLPVAYLVSDGSPTWLIGPLAALLLLAGELNALSWEARGTGAARALTARRFGRIGVLTAWALGAAMAVGVMARMAVPGGLAALVLASAALAALGGVLFRRG